MRRRLGGRFPESRCLGGRYIAVGACAAAADRRGEGKLDKTEIETESIFIEDSAAYCGCSGLFLLAEWEASCM